MTTSDNEPAPSMHAGASSSDGRPEIDPVPRSYYRQFGPIEVPLRDDRVTEIMVMGDREIYVEIEGKIQLTDLRFSSEDELLGVIHRIVEAVGRKIDEDNPVCDARLADGSRVHAAIRPVAIRGPYLTIRKFSRVPFTAEQLIGLGTATPQVFAFLKTCVEATANIAISGGAATGKTTLLNVLSGYIPADARIVTVEDAAELQLGQRHVASLETRPRGLEGLHPVTVRDLVIASLRMRPDRIIVGECRGEEALDMLQAMNTGHDGSMTTVHANSPRDAISRIETMVLMAGLELPSRAIRRQIASAINIFVQLERGRSGLRRIVQVSEVTGMEEDTIAMTDIFVFVPERTPGGEGVEGVLLPTGLRPRILERAAAGGLEMPPELSELFPAAAQAAKVAWSERF